MNRLTDGHDNLPVNLSRTYTNTDRSTGVVVPRMPQNWNCTHIKSHNCSYRYETKCVIIDGEQLVILSMLPAWKDSDTFWPKHWNPNFAVHSRRIVGCERNHN